MPFSGAAESHDNHSKKYNMGKVSPNMDHALVTDDMTTICDAGMQSTSPVF